MNNEQQDDNSVIAEFDEIFKAAEEKKKDSYRKAFLESYKQAYKSSKLGFSNPKNDLDSDIKYTWSRLNLSNLQRLSQIEKYRQMGTGLGVFLSFIEYSLVAEKTSLKPGLVDQHLGELTMAFYKLMTADGGKISLDQIKKRLDKLANKHDLSDLTKQRLKLIAKILI